MEEHPGSFSDHLRRDSARFREVLTDTPSDAPVPTCPDWDADDLLWHLADVQWFWGTILTRDLRTHEQVEALDRPRRPGDRAGLLMHFDQSTEALQQACEREVGDQERWMWAFDPALHTVDYIRRRQAHEALMHRVDAELTAGAPIASVDADLASDGVDEILTVMFAGAPDGSTFTPDDGRVLRIVAEDTDDVWLVQLGRLAGQEPGSKEPFDEISLQVVTEGVSSATISGLAADLDLWLWGRPSATPLESTGDEQTLTMFGEIIAEGRQ